MSAESSGSRLLVRVELALPRDARFVAVMRDMARCVLRDLGAPEEAREDIEIAVTEACANAVRHAVGSAGYEVRLAVSVEGCEVEIADQGPGLAADELERAEVDIEAESGRGLLLIEALVDELELVPQEAGTRLRLHKSWNLSDGVSAAAADGDRGPRAAPPAPARGRG